MLAKEKAKEWGIARAKLSNCLTSLTDNIQGLQWKEARTQIEYLAGGEFGTYIAVRADMHKKIRELAAQLNELTIAECNAFVEYLGFELSLEEDIEEDETPGPAWLQDLPF